MQKATKQQQKAQKRVATKKPVNKKVVKKATKTVQQRTFISSVPRSIQQKQQPQQSQQQSQSQFKLAISSSSPSSTTMKSKQMKFIMAPLHQSKRFGGWGYSHFTPEDEVEHRVMEFLKTIPAIKQENLTKTAHFQHDLGLDSLQQVELVMMLEHHFRVEINDDDAGLITRVDHATHYLSHTPYTV